MSSSACVCSSLTLLLCFIGNTPEYKKLRIESNTVENPSHSLYSDFIDLVELNFSKYHTVRFYAEKLNVSLHTLNMCCKTNVSMTTSAVISNRVIQEAKRLLLFTDMRSSEISSKLGFP